MTEKDAATTVGRSIAHTGAFGGLRLCKALQHQKSGFANRVWKAHIGRSVFTCCFCL